MIDYHVHTHYKNSDAEGSIIDYCKKAKKRGITELAFTNHLIVPKPGEPLPFSISFKELETLFEKVKMARKTFNIKLKVGLEVDYFKKTEEELRKIINKFPFDIVLGSTHFIGDNHVSHEELSDEFDQADLYEKYFRKQKRAIESGMFDVMAHPDVLRRHSTELYGKDLPFQVYEDLVEEVVEALLENNTGIEVNTGDRWEGIESLPSLEYLKVCKKKGLKKVTVGSDAHSPRDLGHNLKKGVKKLGRAGFKKVATFEKRKSTYLPLSKLESPSSILL